MKLNTINGLSRLALYKQIANKRVLDVTNGKLHMALSDAQRVQKAEYKPTPKFVSAFTL